MFLLGSKKYLKQKILYILYEKEQYKFSTSFETLLLTNFLIVNFILFELYVMKCLLYNIKEKHIYKNLCTIKYFLQRLKT